MNSQNKRELEEVPKMKTFVPSTEKIVINLDNYRKIKSFTNGYGEDERIEIHIYFPDTNLATMLRYKTIEERDKDFERLIQLVS